MMSRIGELVKDALTSIKSMVEVNNIIGDPITTPEGSVVIPVTEVACGFGAGGSDIASKNQKEGELYPFGGGSGGGVSVKPVAFLVISGERVKLIPVTKSESTAQTILGLVPDMVDKVDKIVAGYVKKDKTEKLADEQ